MNEVIKFWLQIMRDKEIRFGLVKTTRAIFDRVAILDTGDGKIVVEYPLFVKGKWMIKHEIISFLDVVRARYYQN